MTVAVHMRLYHLVVIASVCTAHTATTLTETSSLVLVQQTSSIDVWSTAYIHILYLYACKNYVTRTLYALPGPLSLLPLLSLLLFDAWFLCR